MVKKYKVLQIEDNPGDAFLLEEMLYDHPEYDFELTTTETIKEAIATLRNSEFDVILLDLGLPDSEGLNGLESILGLNLNYPIVVITGLNDEKTGQMAVEMGAQNYMVKGNFESENIIQTIRYSIDRNKILKQLVDREEQLKAINKELTEANAAKKMLISVISHDLRGPLNSIVNLLEIANNEYDDLDEKLKKRYLKSIFKSAVNTRELMENLLQWAKIQSNRNDVELQNVEVNELIDEGTNPLEQMALEKEIKLELNSSNNLMVYADVRMITTVIRNLVSNAIKFTPRNGKINVSSKTEKNGEVVIEVADTGIGMKDEMKEKIFELGKKTSTGGTENETGTGFGLVICKEFVEKNNGKIKIESKKGEGTSVSITLPAASK